MAERAAAARSGQSITMTSSPGVSANSFSTRGARRASAAR
jgi:hypothetical protein